MKKSFTQLATAALLLTVFQNKKLLFLGFSFLFLNVINAQIYEEKDGYVAMEMESTSSPLDLWLKIQTGNPLFIPSASGGVHLEFNGNAPAGGTAKSPLTFTFKINNSGTYHLLIKASKRLEGELDDKCNDCYIKMAGDFTSPYLVTDITKPNTADLKTNIKLFGGMAHPNMGWAGLLDFPVLNQGHVQVAPLYVFKAGQTYNLTISGRSKRFNLDFFVLYDTQKYNNVVAKTITPTNGPTLGITEVNAKKKIILYQNPASTIVRFSEPVNAVFYNNNGQKVLTIKNDNEAIVSHLPKGVYQVKINNKETIKLILK